MNRERAGCNQKGGTRRGRTRARSRRFGGSDNEQCQTCCDACGAQADNDEPEIMIAKLLHDHAIAVLLAFLAAGFGLIRARHPIEPHGSNGHTEPRNDYRASCQCVLRGSFRLGRTRI